METSMVSDAATDGSLLWGKLPTVVLSSVLSHLQGFEVAHVVLCCKHWREAVTNSLVSIAPKSTKVTEQSVVRTNTTCAIMSRN